MNAIGFQVPFDQVGHRPVEWREHLIEHLDEGHVKAGMGQFSAVSRPMKPPPTTTACRAGFTAWIPE